MEGLSRQDIVEGYVFPRSAVYAALRGWTMNARHRDLRRRAHKDRHRMDKQSIKLRERAEATRGPWPSPNTSQ